MDFGTPTWGNFGTSYVSVYNSEKNKSKNKHFRTRNNISDHLGSNSAYHSAKTTVDT